MHHALDLKAGSSRCPGSGDCSPVCLACCRLATRWTAQAALVAAAVVCQNDSTGLLDG